MLHHISASSSDAVNIDIQDAPFNPVLSNASNSDSVSPIAREELNLQTMRTELDRISLYGGGL